ncbi:hypothetical protein CEQ30_09505 [Nocardia brasiliensis]|nr:hypothetical protein CEQ30_09505 [Nocardia brasiliensis]
MWAQLANQLDPLTARSLLGRLIAREEGRRKVIDLERLRRIRSQDLGDPIPAQCIEPGRHLRYRT